MTICPVCNFITVARMDSGNYDGECFDCNICGQFCMSRSLLATDTLDKLSRSQKSALSHKLRTATDSGQTAPRLNTYDFTDQSYRIPLISEQARNLIRFIGSRELQEGKVIVQAPQHFHSSIGAISREAAMRLMRSLIDDGLMTAIATSHMQVTDFSSISLTLKGWEKFEAISLGKSTAKHGFLALKFGDPELDQFVANAIRPATESLGFALEDMRMAAKAGIIDDLMRQHIRDAAFVLADLTYGNHGAYWEAGYAEGLGKPTIYLCKEEAFGQVHFDTNHCTTVVWHPERVEQASEQIKAVLRRSLGLFS